MFNINSFFIIVSLLFGDFQSDEPLIQKIDGEYIGGYRFANPANGTVYQKKNPTYTILVKSSKEFIGALSNAKKGDVIYLPGDQIYDLTGIKNIQIKSGVTIYSDRGKSGSLGALVFSNSMNANPLFITRGENIKFSGIRFRGPDGETIRNELDAKIKASKSGKLKLNMSVERFRSYGLPYSNFLIVENKNIEVENCEIFNWSYTGIFINKSGNAFVHHCYIHHNQRYGLGYGINIDIGSANIRGNIFDYNRHAIAGSGRPGTSYIAEYNICLANSTNQAHAFDMHGGVDRKDNTNLAGDVVVIENNLFYVKNAPIIKIRGVTKLQSNISNNTFIIVNDNSNGSLLKSLESTLSVGQMIKQSGGTRKNILLNNNKIK